MEFSLDDGNGVIQDFKLDADRQGNVTVTSRLREDVSSIIEDNKRLQNEGEQTIGRGTQTSMRKLGQVSNLQAHMLMQQGIFFDDNAMRKWFRDLDNYLWRTSHKKRKGGG